MKNRGFTAACMHIVYLLFRGLKAARFGCFLFLLLLHANAGAQVKIGDNVGTINANALLELESTNKGLLAPRIALNDLASASPLTAPVPEGMIVYSSNGAVPNGFYFWNGTKWLQVLTSEKERDNYVLVKSAADLPAPSAGIITLAAGKVYEINGTILLTSKINLNGSYLIGLDANSDRIVYTPGSGELFTGTKGGTIKTLTLSAPTAGARLFNLDMPATENLIVRDGIIANCREVGLVKGGYICFFSVINFASNQNGITFQDNKNLLLDHTAWFSSNAGTFEKLAGSFDVIDKVGGLSLPQAATGGVAFDITGITTITEEGNLKNAAFLGDGTKVAGAFSKKWEVEAAGIKTEKDAVATGSLYISTVGTTGINTQNVPVKISGATIATQLNRFTAPVNNRLTYDGTKTRTFIVNAVLSVTGTSGTNTYSFYIYKNGVQVPGSRQRARIYSSLGDVQMIGIACTVTLNPGEYIEVWAENNNSSADLTAHNMTLIIK